MRNIVNYSKNKRKILCSLMTSASLKIFSWLSKHIFDVSVDKGFYQWIKTFSQKASVPKLVGYMSLYTKHEKKILVIE